MKQSTYFVQRPQVNEVRSFILSAYPSGANRVGWPIRWSSSLKEIAKDGYFTGLGRDKTIRGKDGSNIKL
jgi:hypothetical protein